MKVVPIAYAFTQELTLSSPNKGMGPYKFEPGTYYLSPVQTKNHGQSKPTNTGIISITGMGKSDVWVKWADIHDAENAGHIVQVP